jgi:hypothetical protein
MVVLGEKLSRVPWATQPGWKVKSGALFLGSGESVQLYWVNLKGYHVQGLSAGSVHVAYIDWHEKGMCHVYQVSPVGFTSIQISVTLIYE